jgi:hypothetical protein
MNKVRSHVVLLCVALGLAACGKSPAEREAAAAQAVVSSEAPAVAPAPVAVNAVAEKYEDKVVRRPASDGSKEDGWFYVEQGKRRWIVDSSWLQVKSLKPEDVIEIPAAELSQIPEAPDSLGAPEVNSLN